MQNGFKVSSIGFSREIASRRILALIETFNLSVYARISRWEKLLVLQIA